MDCSLINNNCISKKVLQMLNFKKIKIIKKNQKNKKTMQKMKA